MTRRDRLEATLRGQPVDRPAVSFYEVGGWPMDADGDPATVWNDPTWRPLVELALRETDIMRMVSPVWILGPEDDPELATSAVTTDAAGRRIARTTLRAGRRVLATTVRRDPEVQTEWMVEPLLKDTADLAAYLDLPAPRPAVLDPEAVRDEERRLGEGGIVCLDFADALCNAAGLFSLETYTVIALTEPALFRRLLDRFQRALLPACAAAAEALPGRLWRVVGSEYASEPYLPPRLYAAYVGSYTGELVRTIQASGGYARLHSHGRLRGILPHIAAMAPAALDPVEPPPQGDMDLREVRREIGERTVLMGNLEASDIECLAPADFERKVARALEEGVGGRGFVLMPSACPYGRTITPLAMANYRTMLRLARGEIA